MRAESPARERQSGMDHRGRAAATMDARVRAVQEKLKAQGKDPGPIDGILGPRTAQALREYQKDEGLPVTGKADRQTLATLGVEGASPPQSQ
jgi:peptidoglycan hydrolase-like protein with peptidoglycan-binding domain